MRLLIAVVALLVGMLHATGHKYLRQAPGADLPTMEVSHAEIEAAEQDAIPPSYGLAE